jgi:hypothetical protein
MRFGYAFMEVGLAIVKRPLLIQDAASLPKEDGLYRHAFPGTCVSEGSGRMPHYLSTRTRTTAITKTL